MKKIPLLFIILIAFAVSAAAQCNMQIDYSVEDIQSTVHGTLRMLLPDGNTVVLIDDTTRQIKKDYNLNQLGEYRITAIFSSNTSGRDSLERTFILTNEEYKIETILHFQKLPKNWYVWDSKDSITSGQFMIIKYSNPSPLVKIKYLRYCTGENGEIQGPLFVVKNESQDTIYGEYLPGFLWGTLSMWCDGEYVGAKGGVIDLDCDPVPPLYPNAEKMAWVGSFGRKITPGKYRFNLYYSTEDKSKGTSELTSETDSFRWLSDVQNWHLLTCEFEKD